MTAAIGRIVQETGSIVLTPEGPPWCHEAMTTLDSYLTVGRSGLPANLDALVGCLASRSWPHCGVARGPQANRSMGRGAGRRRAAVALSLQLERGRIREADDQALGGLKPSDSLPTAAAARRGEG